MLARQLQQLQPKLRELGHLCAASHERAKKQQQQLTLVLKDKSTRVGILPPSLLIVAKSKVIHELLAYRLVFHRHHIVIVGTLENLGHRLKGEPERQLHRRYEINRAKSSQITAHTFLSQL